MIRPVMFVHRHFIELAGPGPENHGFISQRIDPSEKERHVFLWLSALKKNKENSVDIVLSRDMVIMKAFRFDPAAGTTIEEQLGRVVRSFVPWEPEDVVFDQFETLPDSANNNHVAVITPGYIFCEYLQMAERAGISVRRISVSSLEEETPAQAEGIFLLATAESQSVELAVYERERLLLCREIIFDEQSVMQTELCRQCLLFAREFRQKFPLRKIEKICLQGTGSDNMKDTVGKVWNIQPDVIPPDEKRPPRYARETSAAQKIQLLPPEEKKRQEKVRRRAQMKTVLTPLFCLILIWGLYGHIIQVDRIRKTGALQAKADRMRDQAREAAGILNLRREIEEKRHGKKGFVPGMTVLLEMTPGEIYFQEVDFRTGRFRVKGLAGKEESVREMQDRLQQSRRFVRVKTGSLSRHKILRKDWFRFEMVVEL